MKRPAVFLDRDGTIIKEVDYLHLGNLRETRFLRGAAEAIKQINQLGFLAVIVSNQPVVARGYATEADVGKIHAILLRRLEKTGAKIDAVYFCPHHPNATLPEYRKNCLCRKPNIGMIKKAAKELNIDLKKSFLVGDRTADIAAGNRAGIKMILVKTGYGGKDGKYKGKPDFTVKNLREVAKLIT